MANGVLIIEDEAVLAKNIKIYLERAGFEVRAAASAEEGLRELDVFKPDAVVLDHMLPGASGLDTLAKLHEIDPGIRLIMLTGHGNVEMAVEAMKRGACDFLTKPVALLKLKQAIEKALGEERIEQTLDYYRKRVEHEAGLATLLGESEPMHRLKDTMRRLLEAERGMADGDAPAVLITGETGTGKELVARALHVDGPRRKGPFVELNCSAIPAQLLEAELFGHERGAFTDARERKLGLAEAAQGGTLFLDEIGDMDLALQAKLLKLLESKTVRRLGSVRDSKVDVRIVAATHRRLDQLVQEEKFRPDLYFRLRVVQLEVPALRDRGDDILMLAGHFLRQHALRYGKGELRFSRAAEQALRAHRWPGNVRELRNAIEQTVLLATEPLIDAHQLPLAAAAPRFDPIQGDPCRPSWSDFAAEGNKLERSEREILVGALHQTLGNVTQAARLLGISRDTLRYRIEKYKLLGH